MREVIHHIHPKINLQNTSNIIITIIISSRLKQIMDLLLIKPAK